MLWNYLKATIFGSTKMIFVTIAAECVDGIENASKLNCLGIWQYKETVENMFGKKTDSIHQAAMNQLAVNHELFYKTLVHF